MCGGLQACWQFALAVVSFLCVLVLISYMLTYLPVFNPHVTRVRCTYTCCRETYRCMPPWVRTKAGYAANPHFKRFPRNAPLPFLLLCAQ